MLIRELERVDHLFGSDPDWSNYVGFGLMNRTRLSVCLSSLSLLTLEPLKPHRRPPPPRSIHFSPLKPKPTRSSSLHPPKTQAVIVLIEINPYRDLLYVFHLLINHLESSSLQRFSWFGSKLIPKRPSMEISAFSYQKFVQFTVDEVQRRTQLIPSPLQEQFNCMKSTDGKTKIQMLSFQAPKIRHLRSLCIEGSDAMKVLDLAVFPEPEFDLPIFCANFFTASNTNIIVLDLNPLHDVIIQKEYREKYYNSLMPLGLKYAELLPWGGKITGESLRFFSPIVIWTKFTSSQQNHDVLYSAFVEYFMAWVELMDQATGDKDVSRIICNRAAQHKYLTWRAEKDPGHRLLNRLIGESAAKDLVRNFLFNGVTTLGTKTFVDYFPEYRSADGTVNEKRSMIGKSFETRPWDMGGAFIGKDL